MTSAEILEDVAGLATLGAVLRWAFARTPPAEVVASIAQDEFTVDVVVRAGPGVYLAFDST